jgi:uncharacterized protein (DUF2147 family)
MTQGRRFVIGAAAAACALAGGSASSRSADEFNGVWKNPKNTVHLRLRPCGPRICGDVVWATETARADAARGGKAELVGQQLLRDFMRGDDGLARGKVYVPDLGVTFKGSAQHVNEDAIKVKGCLVGGLICRSQVWTRVTDTAQHASHKP